MGVKKTVWHFELSHQIIQASLAVHRELGPEQLEAAYETCLVHELRKAGLEVKIGSRYALCNQL